jgi:hypothetical protein
MKVPRFDDGDFAIGEAALDVGVVDQPPHGAAAA